MPLDAIRCHSMPLHAIARHLMLRRRGQRDGGDMLQSAAVQRHQLSEPTVLVSNALLVVS